MIRDWLTEPETLDRWEWAALFVIGELCVTPLVRRVWYLRVDQ